MNAGARGAAAAARHPVLVRALRAGDAPRPRLPAGGEPRDGRDVPRGRDRWRSTASGSASSARRPNYSGRSMSSSRSRNSAGTIRLPAEWCPSGRRGRPAKALYRLKPVSRVRIPPTPPIALKSCLFPVLLLLAAEAAAQPAAARECANCHGSSGEGGLTGAPPLAGLPQTYLVQQLAAYADGSAAACRHDPDRAGPDAAGAGGDRGVLRRLARTADSAPDRRAAPGNYKRALVVRWRKCKKGCILRAA